MSYDIERAKEENAKNLALGGKFRQAYAEAGPVTVVEDEDDAVAADEKGKPDPTEDEAKAAITSAIEAAKEAKAKEKAEKDKAKEKADKDAADKVKETGAK